MGIFRKANQDHPIYRTAVLILRLPTAPQRDLAAGRCPDCDEAFRDDTASVARDGNDVIDDGETVTDRD